MSKSHVTSSLKKYSTALSKTEINQFNSTLTGNYILTPKTRVCPGTLTKFVAQKASGRFTSSVLFKQPSRMIELETKSTSKEGLVLNFRQGTFEIHFVSLILSETAPFGKYRNYFLKFAFFSHEKSVIPLNDPVNNLIVIEASVVYFVEVNHVLVSDLAKKTTAVELHAQKENSSESCCLASSDLNLESVLESPSTDIQTTLELFDSEKASLFSDLGATINIGRLSVWFRLNCNPHILDRVMGSNIRLDSLVMSEARKTSDKTGRKSTSPHFSETKYVFSTISLESFEFEQNEILSSTRSILEPTDSETENFQEALDLVLARNKALRTTQSEISLQLKERTKWLHEESKWKRTLQEHAILRGRNPEQVQWRQWRTESTAKMKLQNYDTTKTHSFAVVINVKYMKLRRQSEIMQSDKYQSFYVEYSFLTHEDVECPFSVPKSDSEKFVFNFERSFSINPKTHSDVCQKLVKCVRKNEKFTISVVGEPGPHVVGIPCCQEVCTAQIPIMDLIENNTNKYECNLALFDRKRDVDVGYLRLYVEGVLAMRKIALKMLSNFD